MNHKTVYRNQSGGELADITTTANIHIPVLFIECFLDGLVSKNYMMMLMMMVMGVMMTMMMNMVKTLSHLDVTSCIRPLSISLASYFETLLELCIQKFTLGQAQGQAHL